MIWICSFLKIRFRLRVFCWVGLCFSLLCGCGDAESAIEPSLNSDPMRSSRVYTNNQSPITNNNLLSLQTNVLSDRPVLADSSGWKSATESMKSGGRVALKVLLFVLIALLCVAGILLSMLSFSGTWVLFGAGLISTLTLGFPNLGTLILFLLICIIVEVLEAVAGFYGIKKKGGSKWAGFACFVGGVLGAMLGSAVLPIIGTLLGLLVGSFLGVFVFEWLRIRDHNDAASIAWGAFFARLGIIFLKLTLTVVMSIWLLK